MFKFQKCLEIALSCAISMYMEW